LASQEVYEATVAYLKAVMGSETILNWGKNLGGMLIISCRNGDA